MTKPEPLKGKPQGLDTDIERYFMEDDIRSAVEWLKEEYYQMMRKCFSGVKRINGMTKLIDEAFEDVMK